MLDLAKLIPQFEGMSPGVLNPHLRESVERAQGLLAQAGADSSKFEEKLIANATSTFWPLSNPIEPLNCSFEVTEAKPAQCVVAVDGSQIMPTHHDVYNCYLINIGSVSIVYGRDHSAELKSTPHLFHTIDDLYPAIDRRRMYVDETFVAMERALLELAGLRDLALAARRQAPRVVALADGSIILWSLDKMPESYQRSFVSKLTDVFDSFATNDIPIVGYISHSRSSDVINMLRVWQCPYQKSLCSVHCNLLCEEDFPCSTIWPVTDRQLYGETLSRNARSPLFRSGHMQARLLPPQHHVVFTYVNTGTEVARIEVPTWLAENTRLLDLALATVMSQAAKGNGYPVSLSEAHNLAVIHGSDRQSFFELVQNHLVQLGMPAVRVSPKETGKRRGIV